MKKTQSIAILLAASLAVACGSLSPSAPDDPVAADGAVSTARVQASSFGNRPAPGGPAPVPTADPGPTCGATSLSLEVSGSPSQAQVTPVFLDQDGKPVSWQGCPLIEWSVSPEGGVLVPVPSPREDSRPQTMMLMVLGADRVYTIAATASAMKASVEVGPQKQPGPNVPAPVPTASPGSVCGATSLSIELGANRPQVYVTPVFLGPDGNPVSGRGCPSIRWSVSPADGVLVPVTSPGDDGGPQTMMLVVLGAGRLYAITATADTMTASAEVRF